MIDQFISFVIRPPRAEYNPDHHLWEKDFTLKYRKYKREDLELKNERGHKLMCSHYLPAKLPDNTPLPCVVYCHGNSGCRADAKEAIVFLLPFNITVFTLDFSGSGLSGGDYVSLGWHEKNDLKVVVSYLKSNVKVSRIGLWGRSMGAVTSLLYGVEDNSIAGMVLDSAFSNLSTLMMELADLYKVRLPKFTVKMLLRYMRRAIRKKAEFDIMQLDCIKVAQTTCIPALFGHGKDDKFIQPRHTDDIFKAYAGNKNITKFGCDHNSDRPGFYYKSVTRFFFNALKPPQLPSSYATKIEKYYDLGNLKLHARSKNNLLFRSSSANASSSSDEARSISDAKFVAKMLPAVSALCKENPDIMNEECHSSTSSNKGSWGSCSSLNSIDVHSTYSTKHKQTTLKMLLEAQSAKKRTVGFVEDEESKKKKKNKEHFDLKKSKLEKFEKLRALSERFRISILGRGNHRRFFSS